jgi:hypothetical protein
MGADAALKWCPSSCRGLSIQSCSFSLKMSGDWPWEGVTFESTTRRKRSQYLVLHLFLCIVITDPLASTACMFPFDTDPDDHCESPLEAYRDIVPLLQSFALCRHPNQPSPSSLSIYDPYYCNGAVKRHLASLGFPNVYNEKEDCYQIWQNPGKYPPHDIFITNPPYSGDHIEKLMRHVTTSNKNKPWMLLMPTFVHKKEYYLKFTKQAQQQPIYLVPHKRYVYQPPSHFRAKKASDTHKKSSPFVSMWYLWGGSSQVTEQWYKILLLQQNKGGNNYDVARSKSALRDLRRKKGGSSR